VTKEITKKAIHGAVDDLLTLARNLCCTGEIVIRIQTQQGTAVDYGYTIEKKSCIRSCKDVQSGFK